MKKKVKKKLNFNQEAFCQYYANGGEYFGNAVWSYILAYKLPIPLIDYRSLNEIQKRGYDSAKQMASKLFTNIYIKERCNELLDALIKNEIVDRELVKVILQNDELSAKVSAIKEYNQLKNRIKQPGIDKNNPLFITISKEIAQKRDITSQTK